MPFRDRADAGRRLAERLAGSTDWRAADGEDVVVLGLPRGGVPVAAPVARALRAPLDVLLVRKLGVPFQPELAMGAIGEDGVRVLNREVLGAVEVGAGELEAVEQRERAELDARLARLRGARPRVPLAGRTAILVDDGIATGSTARAACALARVQGAARVVIAVPVLAPPVVPMLRECAEAVVYLEAPAALRAIGEWYRDFTQTSDAEVLALLGAVAGPPAASHHEQVVIQVDAVRLDGRLTVPAAPGAVVLFAHGTGSGRNSPRNQHVATALQSAGLGTLLLDLLTAEEEADRRNVFDVQLLAARLLAATQWMRSAAPTGGRGSIGYFGASTGAAAALWAAAEPGAGIAAVVSRGGRPDLAAGRLAAVPAPTLLVVGGRDDAVLELNRGALAQLRCERELAVVPGATHLFEERGALDAVAALARDWFVRHLLPAAEHPVPGRG